MKKSFPAAPFPWRWAALFFLAIVLITAGGFKYYQYEKERIRDEKYHELSAIAELKCGQIRQWRAERLAEAGRVVNSPLFKKAVSEYVSNPDTPELTDSLKMRLKSQQAGDMHANILLLDMAGRPLLSLVPEPHPLELAEQKTFETAVSKHQPVLSDFFRHPDGRNRIDTMAPVLDRDNRPIAVLSLNCCAEMILYPLIQSWPTESRTAETLLVCKDGDSVLFLNNLRHRSNTALSMRMPLARTDLPAVQAVLGKKGIFEGVDYRGKPVLADLRPIPDSLWFMVAKVDRDEILAEVRYRAEVISLFVALFILLSAFATAHGFRRRQAGLYLDLYQAERQQREAREEFRTTLYSIGDAVITTDISGRIRQMNPEAERLTGWTEADAGGKALDDVFCIINEDTRAGVENPVQRVLREGKVVGLANHTLLISKDGVEHPIADSGAPIRDESTEIIGVVLVFRDQTEERIAQNALQESENQYHSLFDNMLDGYAHCRMLFDDQGRPTDFIYLNVNKSFERLTGLKDVAGKKVTEAIPKIRELSPELFEIYGRVSLSGNPERFEIDFKPLARWFSVSVYSMKKEYFIAIFDDITDQKLSEQRLQESEARVRRKLDSILLPKGDIGALELVDIMDVPAIQSLMEDLSKLLGISVSIIDIKGKMLAGAGGEDICGNFHRVHPKTREYCIQSDVELSRDVLPGKFKLYKCKNNMWDVVTPIIVGGKRVGNVFSGQFFFDDESVDYDYFKSQAEKYGFNEDDYITALKKAPRVSRQFINTAMAYFTRLADMISKLSYSNIKLAKSLSAQERTLQQLKESEENLNKAQALAQMGSWTVEFSGKKEIWNVSDEIYRIYDLAQGTPITAKTVAELMHPDDLNQLREIWAAAKRGQGPGEWEHRIIANGRTKWVHVHADFQFNETGEPIWVAGTNQDITESKRIEDERKITLDLLRLTTSSLDETELMQKVALLLQERTGFEAIGIRLRDGDDYPYFETRGFPPDFVLAEKHLCLLDPSGQPIRDIQGYPILECMCGNILRGRFDPRKSFFTGRGSFWSNCTTELLSTTTDADRQARTRNRCNGEGYESVALIALRTGETVYGLLQFNDRRKGRFTLEFITFLEELADHLANAIALRLSQQNLRQSEEKYRQLFESGNDAVLVCRFSPEGPGKFIDVNRAACRQLGYTQEELFQKTPFDIDLALTAGKILEIEKQFNEHGGAVFEGIHLAKDGRQLPVEVNSHIFELHGEKMVLSIARDVSDRKQAEKTRQKLESQLLQAQKMEAIGRLAGGVAHDFNNMLNVIIGYSEMAISKLHPSDPLYPDIQEIAGAAKRSSELTRQLLAFSRKQIIDPQVIDLNSQMKAMERLLKRIIGEDISLKFELAKDLWPTRLDPSQVDQTVANLAVNSRDAMPDGGTLTIETRNASFDAAYCQTRPGFVAGDYVLFAISDSGCGMNQETLAHVFEPFFTTKQEGKGTGLGLATVYGIVKQNNGFINIYSEPDQGTTIRLYFPRYHGQAPPRPAEAKKAEPVGGRETILLVEDQDQLRRLAKTMLERLGYKILEAASPGEAIVVCEKYEEKIHLLFTDVVMPSMNGKDLAGRIQALKPGIRVLFMSGYTANAIAHRGVLDRGVLFLQKPFSREDLAVKIREAMEG